MSDLPVPQPDDTAQTRMIDLDKVDIPEDSRPHSPDKLASLTEDLKGGQKQEIGVVKSGDRFELIFGKGRVLGMRALKKAQIRARVYEKLTEAQKLDMTFSENEEREDANPIFQAYLLRKMIKASGLSQNKYAQSRGKTKGWASQYMSYLKFPEFVIEVFKAVNTSGANLKALKRLKRPELQIKVAQEVKDGVTKVEDVGNRCQELMPSGSMKIGSGAQNPPDPHADLWSGVRDRIGARCQEAWQIGYVPFKGLQSEEMSWMFALMDRNHVSPQRISAWLKLLAQAIDDAHLPDPDVERQKAEKKREADELKRVEALQKLQAKTAEMAQQAQATSEKYKAINQKAADLWLPKTPQEAKDMKASPLNYRLPNNPAEWAEVEALAPSGPGAVYQWMLGADSYWTRKAARLTWQDLDYSDPLTGCHKLIESLRPGPAPAASNLSFLDELDPETRAMVEADMKLGKIL